MKGLGGINKGSIRVKFFKQEKNKKGKRV